MPLLLKLFPNVSRPGGPRLPQLEFHRANIREKLRVSRSPVDLVKLFLPPVGGGDET
ncbi:MAG TPA: hypothetical protein VFR86_29910 [Burkholderiaceae bacterium]|nr:hypothetical protein [Burkholderiaceae bacterium]